MDIDTELESQGIHMPTKQKRERSAKPKSKAKKKPGKSKAKKKAKRPAKPKTKPKGKKKPAPSVVRSERLDMRLSKAEKAKVATKAKKLRRTVTSLVLEAIEKLK